MEIAFALIAALIIASALGVVVSRNPIHSALCLVVNLLTVAAIFAILEAHFLATVQVIVYAGAIVVLVLFVLMLLNLKVEQTQTIGLPLILVASVTGILFIALAVPMLNEAFKVFPEPKNPVVGSVAEMGKVLYTTYVFPFETSSVLLMAAIVGAVMLARRKGQPKKETRS